MNATRIKGEFIAVHKTHFGWDFDQNDFWVDFVMKQTHHSKKITERIFYILGVQKDKKKTEHL